MPISRSRRIRAGITIGDPSGIGAAIAVKAAAKLLSAADFTIIGDSAVLNAVPGFPGLLKNGVKLIDLRSPGLKNFRFGRIKGEYGSASIRYLDCALKLINAGALDCLITCPICKESVNKAGFKYSGHTEYFIRQTKSRQVVMMLLNRLLKFSLITRHLPIRDVPGALSIEKIVGNVLLTHQALKGLFKISRPKIALCSLNPHASDNGLLGNEEDRVIRPAADILRKKIKFLAGPLAPDTAVCQALQGNYDALIAMYHDQALIPLKITGRESGVNLSLGLPFIRTSPLHGTAFDIAGQHELANPDSLIAAIKLAVECASIPKKD